MMKKWEAKIATADSGFQYTGSRNGHHLIQTREGSSAKNGLLYKYSYN